MIHIKKKDIPNLKYWKDERIFDYIYVVPSKKKMDRYTVGYFIGRIGEEYGIISQYDCGTIGKNLSFEYIRFDFEDIEGGIKLWNGFGGKLEYLYGGTIKTVKNY